MSHTRVPRPVSLVRDVLSPDPRFSMHLVGDLQMGANREWDAGMRHFRKKIIQDQFNRMANNSPKTLGHYVVGDMAHHGLTIEDQDAQSLLAPLATVAPVHPVIGNHDTWDNARTSLEWAASWGLPSQNYVVDYPDYRCIAVGHPGMAFNADGSMAAAVVKLDAEGLAFLDASLGGTAKPCLVFCHAPLIGTAGTVKFGEAAQPAASIDAILNAHSNAIAWVSGHIHTSIKDPNIFMLKNVGSRSIVAVNVTGLANTIPFLGWTEKNNWDRMHTQILTIRDEKTIQLRYLQMSGAWDAPGLSRVLTAKAT